MKILVVQTNTYKLLSPTPLGATLVARRLQQDGHDVRFVDLMFARDPVATAREAASEFRPDLVCYSIRNRDNMDPNKYFDPIPGIAAVGQAVRQAANAPTVLGGTAFTTFPSRMLQAMQADYGIAGDDLAAVSRFVASLAGGTPDRQTPGLVYRGDGGRIVENPFTIVGYQHTAFDIYDLVDLDRYRKGYWQAGVVTRTGCPEHCAYCDTFLTFGKDILLREPEEVVDELLRLKRTGKVRAVFLVDAGFNRPLDHAKEILRQIIRRGAQLQLNCVFDPGPADREFFTLFHRAGGLMATVFAESLSDQVLHELGKSFTVAEILRDTAWMREAGVDYMFRPTFGSPGETWATVEETLRLLPRVKASYLDLGIGWRIQPRTPLFDRAVREGLISADDDCWTPTFYVSPQTPRAELTRRITAYKRRHPWYRLRLIPFIYRAMTTKPWKRGPEAV
jgi:radical SAM superfamily enzyme YgiQ (UPF0313 family)